MDTNTAYAKIVEQFIQDPVVEQGNMMSSPALTHRGKVFAFHSKKGNMVFKLEHSGNLPDIDIPVAEFNPFKKKGPLRGWYEVQFEYHAHWAAYTAKALSVIKAKAS